MDQNILIYIVGGVALLIGIVAGKFIFAKNTKQKIDEAEAQAKKIVSDAEAKAETIKQQRQLEAKEKFLQLKGEHDKEVHERATANSTMQRTGPGKKSKPLIRKWNSSKNR
jgi:ribonuclease Y